MPLTQSQQAFVDKVTPYALDASQQTGIDPRVIIAQAALESAWGTAAPGNNYFGIKGPGQSLATTEYNSAGKPHGETASFRAYDSPAASFQSYADLMNGPSRYAPVRGGQDMAAQIGALGKSGYATDPQYGALVAGIANQLPQISAQPSAPPTPPRPNMRADALAFQGFDAAPPLMPPSPTLAAFAQPPGPTAAPQAPTQTASSWLPPSLQQGGSGFVDNLGGGSSPLHDYKVFEPSTVPAGPFGTDALVRAAMSGDAAAVKQAMNAITGAAIGAIFSGQGSKDQITQQINDYLAGLATAAPGAARAIQAASTANPQLFSALAPDQQAQVKAALAALPPQATGQTAMPNLRPPGLSGTDPLVAGNAPDPLAPKPAAFELPDFLKPQPLAFNSPDVWLPQSMVPGARANTAGLNAPQQPFAPGDNLDVRTDGEGNASPISYQPPAPDAAGLAQLFGRGTSQEVASVTPADQTAVQGPAGMPSPSAADAGRDASPRQYWTPPSPGPDFGGPFWNPSSAMAVPQFPQAPQPPSSLFSPPPFPSPASLNPTQMRGLEGPTGQGKINYAPLMAPGLPNFTGLPPGGINYAPLLPPGQPFFGTPQSMTPKPTLRPPMPTTAAIRPPVPQLRPPPTRQVQVGQLPPMPTPRPMSPQDAFQAQYGPAPQNVNWAATLAPDPFSQAAPGTYVLNDYGSHGPPQNDLQEAASQQGDSYLNYPDFSFGY